MREQKLLGIEQYLAVSDASPTGLIWLARPKFSRVVVGAPAFTSVGASAPGYYQGVYNGVQLKAHRVVFYLTHGYWPAMVDHIDGNPLNNKPDNLRVVTASENQHNVAARGTRKNGNKWQVNIQCDYERITFGAFNTEEEAHQAYLDTKKLMHPTAPNRLYVNQQWELTC